MRGIQTSWKSWLNFGLHQWYGMQQKLAVASVLLLAMLAGASAFLIEAHAWAPSQTHNSAPSQTGQSTSTAASTNSTSTSQGGSLLTNSTQPYHGSGNDGNETAPHVTNSTWDE
jgi:hypothetical protein